jgi:uncharacterized membrane protein
MASPAPFLTDLSRRALAVVGVVGLIREPTTGALDGRRIDVAASDAADPAGSAG